MNRLTKCACQPRFPAHAFDAEPDVSDRALSLALAGSNGTQRAASGISDIPATAAHDLPSLPASLPQPAELQRTPRVLARAIMAAVALARRLYSQADAANTADGVGTCSPTNNTNAIRDDFTNRVFQPRRAL
jgi:hypothetical protein